MGKHRTDKCQKSKYDCFAYTSFGRCRACSNTYFEGECPFYKTAARRHKEHVLSVTRLEIAGRYDLISKYGENGEQARVWGEI